MSLIKHDIPILEYDSDVQSVIMPTHEKLNISLPAKAVFAFLGDYIDRFAKQNNGKQIAEFVSATKNYPVYAIQYKGEEICLVQAPVGAAPAAQLLDWLIGYGVRNIISSGSCGALAEIPENTFLVPTKALRDEGTSYHYAPPSRFISVHPRALEAIQNALEIHGLSYRQVVTWSTDGFYRETKEKVNYRKEEGCSVVEMECSALAACAALRGAIWGELLFTADTLASTDEYDQRNWGKASIETALELCLDAVSFI